MNESISCSLITDAGEILAVTVRREEFGFGLGFEKFGIGSQVEKTDL